MNDLYILAFHKHNSLPLGLIWISAPSTLEDEVVLLSGSMKEREREAWM